MPKQVSQEDLQAIAIQMAATDGNWANNHSLTQALTVYGENIGVQGGFELTPATAAELERRYNLKPESVNGRLDVKLQPGWINGNADLIQFLVSIVFKRKGDGDWDTTNVGKWIAATARDMWSSALSSLRRYTGGDTSTATPRSREVITLDPVDRSGVPVNPARKQDGCTPQAGALKAVYRRIFNVDTAQCVPRMSVEDAAILQTISEPFGGPESDMFNKLLFLIFELGSDGECVKWLRAHLQDYAHRSIMEYLRRADRGVSVRNRRGQVQGSLLLGPARGGDS